MGFFLKLSFEQFVEEFWSKLTVNLARISARITLIVVLLRMVSISIKHLVNSYEFECVLMKDFGGC